MNPRAWSGETLYGTHDSACMTRQRRLALLIMTCVLISGCSLLYMNAVRKNHSSVKFIGGEDRQHVRERLGSPARSTTSSDYYKFRGRFDRADAPREFGAMTAFTFGLGEVILFPYVLVTETGAAVAESFCVELNYDANNRAQNYGVFETCDMNAKPISNRLN